MTKQQHFRNWMNKIHEEHGRNRTEFDYDSYAAGWRQALKEVRKVLDDYYSKDELNYLLKRLEKIE